MLDPLVIPLSVIMSGELASCFPERPFAKKDHPIETFISILAEGVNGPRLSVGAGKPVAGEVNRDDAEIFGKGRNLRLPVGLVTHPAVDQYASFSGFGSRCAEFGGGLHLSRIS